MEFGKLSDISSVNFAMPDDAFWPSSEGGTSAAPLQLYLGATGWAMPGWVGKWYPNGTKANQYLHAYSRQFNTIELNTTHYRIPDEATVLRWREAVPPGFRFCPKVPQSISHDGQLALNKPQYNAFLEALRHLGESLGCVFLQLPPYFGINRLDMLVQWLAAWPVRELPISIELRHESWFSSQDTIAQWSELLAELGAGTVITDVAGRRDVLHMSVTAPFVLVRFVGNGLHPTDYQRADDWLQRLFLWQQKGLQQAFFFPHQPDNELAPNMIAYLAEHWNKQVGQINIQIPEPVLPLSNSKPNTGVQTTLF